MKWRFELLIPVFIIGTLLLLSSLSSAQTTSNVSVNITIQAVSRITVLPDSLNWTLLSPGTLGGIYNLTIKNTGSLNVSSIYAYVNTNETETVRPYGNTAPSNWSSGNLLVIRNNSDTRFYWGQRKEWNVTSDISNIDLSAIASANSRASRGFLRNVTNEFVWAVGNGTNQTGNPGCNNTGTIFAIEDDVDTGTTATRTPTATSITRDGGDDFYSYFSVNRATSPIPNACVAVRYDCTYILVYKFDRRSGFSTCVNAANIRTAPLLPAEIDFMHADAWVPYGIPNGQLYVATMTVTGT